jgi:Kef-type K+ transport system membrane component KefB
VLCMIPVRESLALAVLMNTKGLVELIVLNIGKEKKVSTVNLPSLNLENVRSNKNLY